MALNNSTESITFDSYVPTVVATWSFGAVAVEEMKRIILKKGTSIVSIINYIPYNSYNHMPLTLT